MVKVIEWTEEKLEFLRIKREIEKLSYVEISELLSKKYNLLINEKPLSNIYRNYKNGFSFSDTPQYIKDKKNEYIKEIERLLNNELCVDSVAASLNETFGPYFKFEMVYKVAKRKGFPLTKNKRVPSPLSKFHLERMDEDTYNFIKERLLLMRSYVSIIEEYKDKFSGKIIKEDCRTVSIHSGVSNIKTVDKFFTEEEKQFLISLRKANKSYTYIKSKCLEKYNKSVSLNFIKKAFSDWGLGSINLNYKEDLAASVLYLFKDEGLSYNEVAIILNEKLGTNFTRSSISGFLHRRGVSRDGIDHESVRFMISSNLKKSLSEDVVEFKNRPKPKKIAKKRAVRKKALKSVSREYDPKKDIDIHNRIDELRSMASSGSSLSKMGKRIGVDYRRIKRVLRYHGISIKTPSANYNFHGVKGVNYNVIAKKNEGWYIKSLSGKFLHLNGKGLTDSKSYAWRGKSYQADAMMSKFKSEIEDIELVSFPEAGMGAYKLSNNGVG